MIVVQSAIGAVEREQRRMIAALDDAPAIATLLERLLQGRFEGTRASAEVVAAASRRGRTASFAAQLESVTRR